MRTCCVGLCFVFACAAMSFVWAQESSHRRPSSGNTTPSPNSGSTARPGWQQSSEAFANGVGEDAGAIADLHRELAKVCGHDVQVKWDWASFDGHTFDMAPTGVGRMCTDDTLNTIRYYCASAERAQYRKTAVAITSVTCRYKACTELPPSSWTRDDGVLDPGYEYAYTNNGTNLDKSFCEKTSFAGTWDLDRWFKAPHYPKVRKPGSATRP
jgi:hypothetical protein